MSAVWHHTVGEKKGVKMVKSNIPDYLKEQHSEEPTTPAYRVSLETPIMDLVKRRNESPLVLTNYATDRPSGIDWKTINAVPAKPQTVPDDVSATEGLQPSASATGLAKTGSERKAQQNTAAHTARLTGIDWKTINAVPAEPQPAVDYLTAPDRVSFSELGQGTLPTAPVPAAPAEPLDRQSLTLVNGLRPEAADQTGSDFQREMREKRDQWLQETVDRTWEEADEDRYLYPNPRRAAGQKRVDTWNYLDYDDFEDHPAAQQRTRNAQSPLNEADYSSIPDRQSFTSVNLPDLETGKLALYTKTVGQEWGAVPYVLADTARQSVKNLGETRSNSEYQALLAQRGEVLQLLEYFQADSQQYKNLSTRLAALNKQIDDLKVKTPVSPESEGMRRRADADRTKQQFLEGMSPTGRFLGQAALAIGQNAVLLPAAAINPAIPLIAMGTRAASDKAHQLNLKGADPKEALVRGTVSGVIEAATESIPLRSVMNLVKTGGSSVIVNLLKQAGIEATEEGISYATNYLADEAARDPTAAFSVPDLLYAAAQGGLSGAFFGLAGSALGEAASSAQPDTQLITEATETLEPSAASRYDAKTEADLATEGAGAAGKLDWDSVVSKKGETRLDHINRHSTPNSSRATHGVFNGDSQNVVNQAWNNRGRVDPIKDGMGGEIYNIPMKNAGYESGYNNTGVAMDYVTIIVKEGTSEVIAAFPSCGNYGY